MLSARACNAQHASAAARRAGMRERFERALTVFFPIEVASARPCKNRTPAPRYRETGAISSTQYAKANDAQLMLSVAVEARRTLIGRTTTLAPTWTRL